MQEARQVKQFVFVQLKHVAPGDFDVTIEAVLFVDFG
jgi:hypothetical protein